jgi:hypothetical protein
MDGHWQYNPAFYGEIEDLFQAHNPALIVLMLEGGECARSGFHWPAEPFDFCLPGESLRPVQGLGGIIPYDLMRENARSKHYLLTSEFLAKIALSRQAPWVSISPPPVVGDDAFLIRMLLRQPLIRDEVRASGVPPAEWRRKMWVLLTSLMREMYESHDAPFLLPPAGTIDKDGFLAPEFYHDALHGNRHYGALVLRQIDEVLAQVTERETV